LDIYARQKELEITSVSKGVDRYNEALASRIKADRAFDGGPEKDLLVELMVRLVPAMEAEVQTMKERLVAHLTTGVRVIGFEWYAVTMDPAALAYITLRSMLVGDRDDSAEFGQKTITADLVGQTVALEFTWSQMREAESARAKETGTTNRIQGLKRTVKEIKPKSIKKFMKKLDDLSVETPDRTSMMRLGLALMSVSIDTLPDVFTVSKRIDTGKKNGEASSRTGNRKAARVRLRVNVSRAVTDRLISEHNARALTEPLHQPMVCPPEDFVKTEGGYQGGYLTMPMPLIKPGYTGYHTNNTTHVPDTVLNAVNTLNKTKFKINRVVLDTAKDAINRGLSDLMPVGLEKELPTPVPKAEWDELTPAGKYTVKRARAEVHDYNFRNEGKRKAMMRKLTTSEQFADEEAIYLPHNLDFRGRAYPLANNAQPQSDDLGRALLTFAEGKPLGYQGFLWLVAHAVSAYGEDKLTMSEKHEWFEERIMEFAAVARDPFGEGLEFWLGADEPWQFYAAAVELENAQDSGDVLTYCCSLPISVDGSCNGLQHLSAMGKDPIGAHATNLTDDPVRQDIYQIVADKVASRVEDDRYAGPDDDPDVKAARAWHGHVTRKTVKRAVMTTPYGVTDHGITQQLLGDKMCDHIPNDDRLGAAMYLTKLILEAREGTVVKSRLIMDWLKDNTDIRARQGKGVSWVTPTGMRIRQDYRVPTQKTVRTIVGSCPLKNTLLNETTPSSSIVITRQKNSIAPNVVHSFDAAHMMLTINRAAAEGITDFVMVHDSFGCHAADMPQFRDLIREEFVKIYTNHDWLASIQSDLRGGLDEGTRLIPPPTTGEFNVNTVLKSEFFFS